MKQGANVLLAISSSSSTGQAFFLELECTEDAAGTLRELQVWSQHNNVNCVETRATPLTNTDL